MDSLFHVVITCVLNQSRRHWLPANTLQFVITMCLKCREEISNLSAPVNLIDDDFGIAFELSLFASNIKRKVCGVLDFFEKLKKEELTTCCL